MKIFFVIILLVMLFYFIINNSDTFTSISNFQVVTYDNNPDDPHILNLKEMLEKNNYKYTIIGEGEEWNGWYGRATGYIKYLSTLDPEQLVLMCDGRDVLINQNSSTFLTKYNHLKTKYGDRIIIGTEYFCCTGNDDPVYRSSKIPKDKKDHYDVYMSFMEKNAPKNTNGDYYLNFGMMCGSVKNLLHMLTLLNIQPGQDDQALLYKINYEHPELLHLDHEQYLFCNGPGYNSSSRNKIPKKSDDEMCYFEWDSNKKEFQNIKTKTYPSIIQTPGKFWYCYKKLANKLLNNPKFY